MPQPVKMTHFLEGAQSDRGRRLSVQRPILFALRRLPAIPQEHSIHRRIRYKEREAPNIPEERPEPLPDVQDDQGAPPVAEPARREPPRQERFVYPDEQQEVAQERDHRTWQQREGEEWAAREEQRREAAERVRQRPHSSHWLDNPAVAGVSEMPMSPETPSRPPSPSEVEQGITPDVQTDEGEFPITEDMLRPTWQSEEQRRFLEEAEREEQQRNAPQTDEGESLTPQEGSAEARLKAEGRARRQQEMEQPQTDEGALLPPREEAERQQEIDAEVEAEAEEEEEEEEGEEPPEWDGSIDEDDVDADRSWNSIDSYTEWNTDDDAPFSSEYNVYVQDGTYTPPGHRESVDVHRTVVSREGDSGDESYGSWTSDRGEARAEARRIARENHQSAPDPEEDYLNRTSRRGYQREVERQLENSAAIQNEPLAEMADVYGNNVSVMLEQAEFEYAGTEHTAYRYNYEDGTVTGPWRLNEDTAREEAQTAAAEALESRTRETAEERGEDPDEAVARSVEATQQAQAERQRIRQERQAMDQQWRLAGNRERQELLNQPAYQNLVNQAFTERGSTSFLADTQDENDDIVDAYGTVTRPEMQQTQVQIVPGDRNSRVISVYRPAVGAEYGNWTLNHPQAVTESRNMAAQIAERQTRASALQAGDDPNVAVARTAQVREERIAQRQREAEDRESARQAQEAEQQRQREQRERERNQGLYEMFDAVRGVMPGFKKGQYSSRFEHPLPGGGNVYLDANPQDKVFAFSYNGPGGGYATEKRPEGEAVQVQKVLRHLVEGIAKSGYGITYSPTDKRRGRINARILFQSGFEPVGDPYAGGVTNPGHPIWAPATSPPEVVKAKYKQLVEDTNKSGISEEYARGRIPTFYAPWYYDEEPRQERQTPPRPPSVQDDSSRPLPRQSQAPERPAWVDNPGIGGRGVPTPRRDPAPSPQQIAQHKSQDVQTDAGRPMNRPTNEPHADVQTDEGESMTDPDDWWAEEQRSFGNQRNQTMQRRQEAEHGEQKANHVIKSVFPNARPGSYAEPNLHTVVFPDGREADISYDPNDSMIELNYVNPEGDTASRQELRGGTMDMLRTFKQLATRAHAAGLNFGYGQPSDKRRAAMNAKVLFSLGYQPAPSYSNEYKWEPATDPEEARERYAEHLDFIHRSSLPLRASRGASPVMYSIHRSG